MLLARSTASSATIRAACPSRAAMVVVTVNRVQDLYANNVYAWAMPLSVLETASSSLSSSSAASSSAAAAASSSSSSSSSPSSSAAAEATSHTCGTPPAVGGAAVAAATQAAGSTAAAVSAYAPAELVALDQAFRRGVRLDLDFYARTVCVCVCVCVWNRSACALPVVVREATCSVAAVGFSARESCLARASRLAIVAVLQPKRAPTPRHGCAHERTPCIRAFLRCRPSRRCTSATFALWRQPRPLERHQVRPRHLSHQTRYPHQRRRQA